MKKKFLIILITAILVLTLSSTAFAAGRVLSYGDSGDDVYELQQMLAENGYFYDEPTGYFGEITESALIDFQYDFGLEADGIAGPATRSFLGLTYEVDYGYDEGGDSSLSRTLYSGMEGDDVYTLQVLLADYGYFYEEPTGFFGDLTEEAVINFQYDYGLDPDGVVGSATIGMLTGSYSGSGSYSSYGDWYVEAVMDAINRTPSTASGYCAAWVTQVFENAGILTYNLKDLRPSYYSYAATSGLADSYYADNTGFNANDYWAYVCYSSDLDDLEPGMIVATRSSNTYLGRQFGHVGIYLGDGQVISSIGYLEILDLSEWERRYNNTDLGSSIAWGYLPC